MWSQILLHDNQQLHLIENQFHLYIVYFLFLQVQVAEPRISLTRAVPARRRSLLLREGHLVKERVANGGHTAGTCQVGERGQDFVSGAALQVHRHAVLDLELGVLFAQPHIARVDVLGRGARHGGGGEPPRRLQSNLTREEGVS